MIKPVFATPAILMFILLPILCLLAGLCMIPVQWDASLFCFIVCLIFVLPLIIWRKQFFLKIFIDDNGITFIYRKEIKRQMLWSEVQDALAINAQGGQIAFVKDKNILLTQKERLKRWKEIFCIRLDIKETAQALYEFTDIIPVPIRDLEKLPMTIQAKFYKKNI